MNIFDIIGPVMVGPSSSHTAGAVKIGYIARKLMGEEIAEAEILLYGSLEERKALVAEQRKEVLKLEQRIAELSADRTMHSRRNPKQLRAERER